MERNNERTPIIYPTRKFAASLLHGTACLIQNMDRLKFVNMHMVDAVASRLHFAADGVDPDYHGEEEPLLPGSSRETD